MAVPPGRRLARLLAACAAALLIAGPALAGRIHAVVVGIDDYTHIGDLEGAVNDARDLADVLRARGADVEMLIDAQATRSNVVAALRAAVARARPGDVVVFTYAGHGGQQPEALPGDEDDAQDEAYLFADFDLTGPAAAERLRDNDIALLLSEAPEDVGVLVVSDSCHSGTMTRAPSAGLSLGRTRYFALGPLEDDPLPPPDPSTYRLEAASAPNVVVVAAGRDDQEIPEIVIDGRPRGALSWTVARALEGAAAADGPADLRDLRAYVLAQVRRLSTARQDPDVVFDASIARRSASPAAQGLHALLNPFGAAEGIKRVEGTEERVLSPAPEPTVHRLAPGEPPDGAPREATLIWDPAAQALYDRAGGDLIGRPADEDALARMVRAWRAARGLALWVPDRPADLRLVEGDDRHAVGETVSLAFSTPEAAPDLRYVTLVNLASDGEVQYLLPSDAEARRGVDLLPPPPEARTLGPFPVIAPVGADTVVAVYTRRRPEELRTALLELNGARDPDGLLAALERHAGDPAEARVALVTLYTEDAR